MHEECKALIISIPKLHLPDPLDFTGVKRVDMTRRVTSSLTNRMSVGRFVCDLRALQGIRITGVGRRGRRITKKLWKSDSNLRCLYSNNFIFLIDGLIYNLFEAHCSCSIME